MELLNQEEVEQIVNSYENRNCTVLKWSLNDYADHLIGYLGDHLRLTVEVKAGSTVKELKFFIKCMPRFDEWKAQYLIELSFFNKEYVMLNSLFKHFNRGKGIKKWTPDLFYIRSDLFVFEDLAELGYKMPPNRATLNHNEVLATVETLARFHSQSYIYEQKKSKELNRPYKIWEDYSDVLQEPSRGQDWRDTGRNAIIDYSKVYSKHKNLPNFPQRLETVITKLYEDVLTIMKPNSEYRNVVIHRDIWINNILLTTLANGKIHVMIVDYQTVLYCPAMMDLSSFLYFNTTRKFRDENLKEILNHYYNILSELLRDEGIGICEVYSDKSMLLKSYEQSILFGITQAAIIVPIISMSTEKREELFSNPENAVRVNVVSRSKEFIEIAREDAKYENRVTELFDEIIERYVNQEN